MVEWGSCKIVCVTRLRIALTDPSKEIMILRGARVDLEGHGSMTYKSHESYSELLWELVDLQTSLNVVERDAIQCFLEVSGDDE